jgi:hypothetical protein
MRTGKGWDGVAMKAAAFLLFYSVVVVQACAQGSSACSSSSVDMPGSVANTLRR